MKGPLTAADSVSGAYLFLPDGPAKPFPASKNAYVVVKGPVRSSVIAKGPQTAHLLHAVHLDINGRSLRIHNEFDIRSLGDTEVAMRLETQSANGQEKGKKGQENGEMGDFYSDLNGYQVSKWFRIGQYFLKPEIWLKILRAWARGTQFLAKIS